MTYETAAAVSQSVSLVVFMGVFFLIVAYALWPSNGKSFSRAARIPLENDEDLPNEKPAATGEPHGR